MQKIPPLVVDALPEHIVGYAPHVIVTKRRLQVYYNYTYHMSPHSGVFSANFNDSSAAINTNFELIAAQNADLKTQIEALNKQNEQLQAAIAQNNAQNVEMKAALNETSAGLNDVRQKITTLSERISAMVTAIPAAVRTLTRNIISVYAAIRAGSIDTLELDMGNADALEHIA